VQHRAMLCTIAGLCVLLAGCAGGIIGAHDPKEASDFIVATGAQGCIYTRLQGQMAAGSGTFLFVGTVGDKTTTQECIKALPPSLP
jgi:hypothetical protein